MASLSALTLIILEQPIAKRMTALVERHRWGAVPLTSAFRRPWDSTVVLVLLDYSLYVWHVLTHQVPA
ncbi:hypothetical protein YTPLAS18_22510 [Nitrospira sp.]|nr:hypothetical protein YTPLAS18_22510 [Nitrospira sp.]